MAGIGKGQLEQIDSVVGISITVENFLASGVDDVVTTAISNALNTAGKGGTALNFQLGNSVTESIGVVADGWAANNLAIFDYTTKERIANSENREVYGRLTHNATVYTLAYYSVVAGVETPFDLGSRAISFDFRYIAEQYQVPWHFTLASGGSKYISDDPRNDVVIFDEPVALQADNTFPSPALSKTPKEGSAVTMIINVSDYDEGTYFARSGTGGRDITLNVANLGFDVKNNGKFRVRFRYLVQN